MVIFMDHIEEIFLVQQGVMNVKSGHRNRRTVTNSGFQRRTASATTITVAIRTMSLAVHGATLQTREDDGIIALVKVRKSRRLN